MIKIISKEKYNTLLRENKLLKNSLERSYDSYDQLTMKDLFKIRNQKINDLKVVEDKIKEIAIRISKTKVFGGNYNRE